jgi:hypothetical protein
MPFSVRKIAITADTATQIAGRDLTRTTHVVTKGVTQKVKLNFIPTAGEALVTIAETEAKAINGYPLPSTDADDPNVFQGSDDIELTADDDLWLYATEAGALYVLIV